MTTLFMLCAASSSAIAQALYFRDACAAGEQATIAAVGDLLFHSPVQRVALARGSNFHRMWEPVAHVFARADVVYGNLEGPAARGVAIGGRAVADPGRVVDGWVYAAHIPLLVFNFHPSVIADLKAGGFHVISTANNHAADRGPLGIDRTIEELENVGLAFTGTRKRGETGRPWSVITRAKGLNIAWLACTYSLNGEPDRDRQVLRCYSQRAEVLAEIKRLAGDPGVDGIILTPHWGVEGSHVPHLQERQFAREAIDTGATAVIGTHPHVIQPWEKYRTADDREGLIIYSTGNFISNQRKLEERSGIIALVELVKAESGKARVAAAGFVPTWVEITSAYRVVENVAANAAALRATLRLLPAANKVVSSAMDQLPKECRADQRVPDKQAQ
jgi:poly-gamma-glutamate synthesis protein (capsule biosynthesis protein)